MELVVLVIHLLIAIALVGVVLIQKSEGGGLGMGSGNMGGMMTTRGSANLLTRATAFLAAAFFATSLILAILAGTRPAGSLDFSTPAETAVPAETPAPTPAQPQVPTGD
ncbi:MAG: hypothetical protein RLY86_3408 [Pseudomonadota bacterium]|jgi:preprotein translocase subunit SecG